MNVLLGLGAVFLVLLLFGLLQPPRDPLAALRAEYVALRRLPKREALADLERRIDEQRRKNPGRSLRWYLEWLVTDLKRAQR